MEANKIKGITILSKPEQKLGNFIIKNEPDSTVLLIN
jgi:hypothetical protein